MELPPLEALRTQVLERLVMQEIQMQRAGKVGLRINDEALNNALTDIAQRNNLQLAQLPEAVSQQGLDYAAYRETVRRDLTLNYLRQRDVMQRIYVSPRELQQFLERQKNRPSELNEYNLSHILIAVPQAATPQQLDDAARRATEVYERAGKRRGLLAPRGAVLEQPDRTRGRLVRLAQGRRSADHPCGTGRASSRPVKSVNRCARRAVTTSCSVNEIRGADTQMVVRQTHVRHILMKPTEIQDDATIRQKLATHARTHRRQGEDFAALAKASSEDPGSASEGGDLGWTNPGTFVPEFEADAGRHSRTARSANRFIPSSAGTSRRC